MDDGTISFNSDGSYTEETRTGIDKSGKWVSEANNQLTLIGDWEEDGKVYTITVLNKDKLQLFVKYDYKKYMHGKHEHDEIKLEVVRTFIKNE
ncbi:hypothetical protein [Saccharicrinis aurantiacus]|uniref:hypothetical protein n=1 Tax=Saccharicrinis aurantiacus TaxID=1849719 RepID=UPI0008386F72|nr:hypothetical protein [Saccharicrinis aurantiacus]